MIEDILGRISRPNDIILDSFAGSGTTGHAVMSLNAKDEGSRSVILIEMGDYADTVTAERVKRVIQGYGSGEKAVDGIGGDFSFYELGPELLKDEMLNEDVPLEKLREYIYYTEVRAPIPSSKPGDKYLLGVAYDTAYYFCYEKTNLMTLDYDLLKKIGTKADSYVIYADKCTISAAELRRRKITFKKIPRDITRF